MPSLEFECDTPVPADPNRPAMLALAVKPMQPKPGNVHVLDDACRIQGRQLHAQALRVMWLDSGDTAGFKIPTQSLVSKRLDHARLYRVAHHATIRRSLQAFRLSPSYGCRRWIGNPVGAHAHRSLLRRCAIRVCQPGPITFQRSITSTGRRMEMSFWGFAERGHLSVGAGANDGRRD